MKKNANFRIMTTLLCGFSILLAQPAFGKAKTDEKPKSPGKVRCTMKFQLKSWSVFYKSAKGTGTITCSNGSRADVKIRSQGGGISFGKENIANGYGKFSPVHSIEELYGKYGSAGGEGGAGKSRIGASLSKDNITLDIKGTGTGGGFGFDFSGFRISPL